MEKECLFCSIAGGGTATEFLKETETLVVFRDIKPHAPVHLLVVPRRHIRSINDVQPGDAAVLFDMLMTAREMAVQEGVAESGYKLLYNVEYGGGQRIFHLHLHLLGGWSER